MRHVFKLSFGLCLNLRKLKIFKPLINSSSYCWRNLSTNRALFHSSVKSVDDEIKDSGDEPKKEDLRSLLEESANLNETNPIDDPWVTPIYPPLSRRSQARHSVRPQIDPKSTSVILFPGQGTQYVGMGKSLLEYEGVKEMFEIANEILRYNLLDLCLNGPKQLLDETVHSQVAVMVTSLAAVEKLRCEHPKMIENCNATAGFSVGEYTALVFGGAIAFEDAVRLLRIRGEAMQAASELHPSGMMTVMFRPDAKVKYTCTAAKEWCLRQGINDPECCVAIYLYPDCRVLSGHLEALKFLEINAEDFGIRKIKYLNVSGAFHSKLMKPAKEVLRKALSHIPIELPLIPIHANVDGKSYTNVTHIIKKLTDQLCDPVKWEQIMHIIYERPRETPHPNTYECGPGRTLKMILKQTNGKAYESCKKVQA